jgi:hypothetical protein
MTRRAALLAMVLVAGSACTDRACGGRGGLPPAPLPMVKDPDGRRYYFLDKGQFKGYYDEQGQVARVEYDSNDDGRADYLARYGDGRQIRLLEVDEDYDGWVDRWEYYAGEQKLEKVGRSRHTRGQADVWRFPGVDGIPLRIEYDEDGDHKVDRTELLQNGVPARIEIDADRDGRMDRWQEWEKGRLRAESLDTKGSGRPDRRLVYGPSGQVVKVEPVGP